MIGNDITAGSSVGGNPFVRQRNVVPAEFTQDQYTLKLDGRSTQNNRLSATGFYAEFPGLDPFPDPSSLVSPFTLRRADRNATVALSDTHIWGANKVNEVRGGVFYLNNSRRLDDPFLDMTNDSVGVQNPANFYDSSTATTRLGHYIGRPGGTMERFSFGGPNDSFNKREQRTLTIGDTFSWTASSHALRMGAEFRRNEFDTNLPEEQATEFEKFDNFTMLLRGLATEADTQFGITDKQFRFNDFNVFLSDEWQHVADVDVERRRSLRVLRPAGGSQWSDRQRRFRGVHQHREPGERLHRAEQRAEHRFRGHRRRDCRLQKADNNHTLKGQDWNNVAPRSGLAWTPSDTTGCARRLRRLLRPAVRGVHQHGVQQLPVPARAGSDVPRERGADERRVVAAGSEFSLQPVPAQPDRPHRRRDRHLPDP